MAAREYSSGVRPVHGGAGRMSIGGYMSSAQSRRRRFAASAALLTVGLVIAVGPRAASAAVTWTQANPPLPANAVTGAGVTLTAASCPADGWCVAVGDYPALSGTTYYEAGVIETESGGAWNATEAPLPLSASPTGPQAVLQSVQCAAVGTCTAVGRYLDATGATQALVEQLSAGMWTPAALALPGDASATGPSAYAQLQTVACPTTGWCAAVGLYTQTSGTEQAFVATSTGGPFTAATAPLPAAAAGSQFVSLACPAAGSCVAPGTYLVGGNHLPMADTLSAGVWSAAALPVPNGTSPSASVVNNDLDVACPAAGSCVVAGTTFDGNYEGLLDTLAGASWSATPTPLPGGATSPDVQLDAVACASPGTCVAVGFASSAGVEQGLLETLGAGAWSASTAPVPTATPAGTDVEVHDVACPSVATCVAEGQTDTNGTVNGLFFNLSGGTWAATPVPLPSDAAASADPAFAPITCPAAGVCLAVGTYTGAAGTEGVIETDPSLAPSTTAASAKIATAQTLTYSATVSGPAQPAGSVVFSSGLRALCSAPLVNGAATCTGPTPPTRQVLASYSGDGSSNPSWGTAASPAAVLPTAITAVTVRTVNAKIQTFFPSRPGVEVTDAAGNPVSNIPVTFYLPTSGPSAVPWGSTTVPTNASGVALCPFLSANDKPGSYVVWVLSSVVQAGTIFYLTNTKS